jgi:hypothetical protein
MTKKPIDEAKQKAGARRMSRTPRCENLLLIAGRIQGMPKISFDAQTLGSTTIDAEGADVCGPIQPNSIKAMMGLKLVSETPMHVLSFADVLRRPACTADVPADDIDAGDRKINGADRI